MGHWETEHGTIKLPTASFAAVRKACQDADNALTQRSYDLSQEFWEKLPLADRRSPERYDAALAAWADERGKHHIENEATDKARILMHRREDKKPRRTMRGDVRFSTNKDIGFYADNGYVLLDKKTSTATWQTDDSRNGIKSSRDSKVGQAFFGALREVKWTRGSGGVTYVQDEYRAEAGFGESVGTGYGPEGAKIAPHQTEAYTDSSGKKIGGDQGRRTNGQFDFVQKYERPMW